jgi:SAM-dependent methyltransferase
VTDVALGCGDPTAIADLEPGAVVLDLGSGGGIDCFLAAQKVGPTGHVIGLDMTPSMVQLARRNAREMGVTNVDFRFGEIEAVPLPDESVDVVISNCVVNLSPDKDAVFSEAFRVLRPGGRLCISDIVVGGELPASVRAQLDLWAACVAGALEESDYVGRISDAGFTGIQVLSRDSVASDDVAVVTAQCCRTSQGADRTPRPVGPGQDRAGRAPTADEVIERVMSVRIRARKPV